MNSRSLASRAYAGLATAAALGIIHAVIDAACVALLIQNSTISASTGGPDSDPVGYQTAFWGLYLLYNFLAFGTQFWMGAIADRCDERNTVAPDEDAMRALARMSRDASSRLMVVEDGRLVGILALKDLLQFFRNRLELEDLERNPK